MATYDIYNYIARRRPLNKEEFKLEYRKFMKTLIRFLLFLTLTGLLGRALEVLHAL